MSTPIKDLIPVIRDRLIEPQPRFWGDDELIKIALAGIKDLWRNIVDLKQEHFLTIDTTNVSMPANSNTLSGVPSDVHKIYMIEPASLTETGGNAGLRFTPLEYNDTLFQYARSQDAIAPQNAAIFYHLHGQGSPAATTVIDVAPKVTSAVTLAFSYIPTLATLTPESNNPIPGESDHAVVAWTVAYARAKEREDRSPDPAWLAVYRNEKDELLASLGLRQYQEPSFSKAVFEEYW